MVSDEQSFGGVLQQLLRSDSPAVRVMNAGCPGYSSWQALQILKERLLRLRPDVVVIATLWSDAQGSEAPDSARHGEGEGRSLLTPPPSTWVRAKIRRMRWQEESGRPLTQVSAPEALVRSSATRASTLEGPTKLAPTHRVSLGQYRRNLQEMANSHDL